MLKRISAAFLALALVGVSFADGLHLARLPRGFAIPGGAPPTTTVPNIAALSSTFPVQNTAAYTALNVPTMAAGTSFADPVTGITTWKISDTSTPTTGSSWGPWYSGMGLSISLPFGTNLDQYHIALSQMPTGSGAYVCDFGLSSSATPGPRNCRALPAAFLGYTAGTASFSRKNSQIMYILTSGAHVRLYDVVAGAFVDSSAASLGYSASWPSTGWPWNTAVNGWFAVDANEDWVSMNDAATSGTTEYALNLVTGATQTLVVGGSLDDTYMGYGPFVTGDQQGAVWDLVNNTTINYSPALTSGNGWQLSQATAHGGTLRLGWTFFNSEGSFSTPYPVAIISSTAPATLPNTAIGTTTVTPFQVKAWGSQHQSGHWWLQSGSNQYSLNSSFGSGVGATSELYGITFFNFNAGAGFRLGHSYSVLGAISGCASPCYYTQPHATIAHDGKIVGFETDMLGSTRVDYMLMEVPVTTGTPPSFP